LRYSLIDDCLRLNSAIAINAESKPVAIIPGTANTFGVGHSKVVPAT